MVFSVFRPKRQEALEHEVKSTKVLSALFVFATLLVFIGPEFSQSLFNLDTAILKWVLESELNMLIPLKRILMVKLVPHTICGLSCIIVSYAYRQKGNADFGDNLFIFGAFLSSSILIALTCPAWLVWQWFLAVTIFSFLCLVIFLGYILAKANPPCS